MPVNQTCETCRFWKFDEREFAYYGHAYVGTCAKGGPKPDGSADTGPNETCDKWEQRRA